MMNDLDKLRVISKKLGRVISQSKTPQLGKIAFYANNQNQITEIFFEGCNLLDETIPSELWELSHLEKLYLNDNQLLNFPLQLIQLKKLRILNLKNNQFQVISSRIQELSSLEALDLCDNKLQTIPIELGNLPHLKKLRLNDNLLTSFPELSGNNFFKNLISLDLDYAKVQELPQWIFKIPNLKFLSLTGLHLNRFPIQICLLKKLERLYLDSTKFQIYPQDFELPDSLKLIVLDGAQISKIPNTIVEKRPLYIRNQMNISSKYSGLQVSIGNLFPELDETLILSSNPEISYKYLKQLYCDTDNITRQTTSRLTDLKVVLLGTGGTGKSSLIQRLCLKNPDDDNIPLNQPQTTHGVNIDYHLTLKGINDIKTNSLYDYTLHFWDFGGQTKYMGLNKLLLTDKAIYIIVLDARTEGTLDWWLSIIQAYAPNSQILIILNKIDENPQANFNFEYYYNKYFPHIYNCFFKISCLYPAKSINKISSIISALRNIIEQNINLLSPIWNYNWNKVRENLEWQYLIKKKAIITNREYKDLCVNTGISDKSEQKLLLDILNISGTCIKFSNGRKNILNPTWIVDYLFLLYNQLNNKTPILDYDEYIQIMEQNDDYDDYIDDILQILEERGLCVSIISHSLSGSRQKKQIFCPTFLPERTDYYEKHNIKEATLKYIFEAKVPLDFEFQRLVSKEFGQPNLANWEAWQYGLSFYLKEFDSEILVELLNNKLLLTIFSNQNYNCARSFLKIQSDILNICGEGFLNEKIVYTQKDGSTAVIFFTVLQNLYFKGIEEYFFPQEDQSGNLIHINIMALGKRCGLSEAEFGKAVNPNTAYVKKAIQEVNIMQVTNYGDFIQSGGTKNIYGDSIQNGGTKEIHGDNTVTITSKFIVDSIKKLDTYISAIKNNLPDISKDDIESINDSLDAIYGELTKREPKKNILRLCISVLEPFLTITNGGFDFTKNLQDLINIVHSHL